MSLRAQIAFSKNFTLQRQLEDKCLDLRRTFKYSRRRLDTVEEECVASLYKLLLYAQEKQGLTEVAEASIINDVFRKSKSSRSQRPQSVVEPSKKSEMPELTRRPATAMSAKTYTQSYSFFKDGLDIGKSSRDRCMRTKVEKAREKENSVKIERLKNGRQSFSFDIPKEIQEKENVTLEIRPKTAAPQANPKMEFKGLTARPHTGNTLLPPNKAAAIQRSPTPAAPILVVDTETDELDSIIQSTVDENPTQERAKHTSAHGRILETPSCLKTIHQSRTMVDGEKSPMIVRITTSRLNDTADSDRMIENATPFRTESRLENPVEEELISLNDDDINHLDDIINTNDNESGMRFTQHSRMGTASVLAPSRKATAPNGLDENLLRKSTERTQSFLTQYSKKSKVFGYVVKTRSSIMAPRERIMTHRSPCITYQELASIKANIKQHESRTRSLLQRSAKLSTYVDKLATAGQLRQRMRGIKQTGTK